FSSSVSISKKIKGSAERNRLKKIVESIKPTNFGVIIRTVSEGKGVDELQKDLLDLISKWELFTKRLKTAEPLRKYWVSWTERPPSCVISSPMNLLISMSMIMKSTRK